MHRACCSSKNNCVHAGRFGGFAGELRPAEVREMLSAQKLVLVDVREEEAREKEGLPELKLAARCGRTYLKHWYGVHQVYTVRVGVGMEGRTIHPYFVKESVENE